MDFLVDPVLFAVPTVTDNNEAHIHYIRQLSRWSDEFVAKRHNFYVWDDCMDALHEAGCFPYTENLRQLWVLADEQVISADMAFMACHRLLEAPNLEEWIEEPDLHSILIDEFQVHPDLLQRLPPEVAAAFKRALGRIAFVKATRDDTPANDLRLVTHPIETEPVDEIAIAAYAVAENHDERVTTDMPLITDPDELDAFNDLAKLWTEPASAIEWLAREMVRQGHLPADIQLAPFRIGPRFVKSIEAGQFQNSPGRLYQIFRKCVLLLSGYIPPDRDAHHTLHKNKQILVGIWGAWRLHVTGSPLALRLHYWRNGNNYILMHIFPFTNMSIDDPPSDLLNWE